MLLIILVMLAVLFLAGGVGFRSHPTYGGYSNGGIGLGGILVIVLVILFFTGYIHL